MNLTSELSIFAYKEPKESGDGRRNEEGRQRGRGVRCSGGGAHERGERGGRFEGAAERTRTSRVIGKASD